MKQSRSCSSMSLNLLFVRIISIRLASNLRNSWARFKWNHIQTRMRLILQLSPVHILRLTLIYSALKPKCFGLWFKSKMSSSWWSRPYPRPRWSTVSLQTTSRGRSKSRRSVLTKLIRAGIESLIHPHPHFLNLKRALNRLNRMKSFLTMIQTWSGLIDLV